MASKITRKTHLKKYLSYGGKWQFFPVAKVNGRPKPELVMIEGKPHRATGGTFYLQWRENGVRRTRPVGTSPREALDAWQLHSGILSGEIEEPEEMPASDKFLTGLSIIGQCLHHCCAKPIIQVLAGETLYRTFDVERLTNHITRFSLAALGYAEPLSGPLARAGKEIRTP